MNEVWKRQSQPGELSKWLGWLRREFSGKAPFSKALNSSCSKDDDMGYTHQNAGKWGRGGGLTSFPESGTQ